MATNNHNEMEDIRNLLNLNLLSQSFNTDCEDDFSIEQAKQIIRIYTEIEGGISVLSDMKSRKSYVNYGASAGRLGLEEKEVIINSIWEDELLNLLHPDDVKKKYRLELRFFQMLNSIDTDSRKGYEAISKLRATNNEGKKMALKHRIIYIGSLQDGSIWLALCLYDIIIEYPGFDAPDAVIYNTRTGDLIDMNHDKLSDVLSGRELEIIRLIRCGNRSKEIADKLSLSIHTVNRHRQNIFNKLNVTNAFEACRIAEAIGLV